METMVKGRMDRFFVVFLAVTLVLAMFPISSTGAAGSLSEPDAQELGDKFGKFMGSFMREMGGGGTSRESGLGSREAGSSEEKRGGDGSALGAGVGRSNRSNQGVEARPYRSSPYVYDPWGASHWGTPLLEGDTWGMSRFADRDWALGKRYYGAGSLSPWEHEQGYGRGGMSGTPPPGFYGVDPESGYEGDWRGEPGGW